MRSFSIVFLAIALIAISIESSWAQRALGAHSLVLDDGIGHTVAITIPTMAGPGPYSWTLPITPGGVGSALVLTGTTNNSTLRWDAASQTWLENTSTFVTNLGAISTNSLSVAYGIISAPSSVATNGTPLTVSAGSSGDFSNGGDLTLNAGNAAFGTGGEVNVFAGSGTPGGFVNIQGGSGLATNNVGGNAYLCGGTGAGSLYGGDAVLQGGQGGLTGSGGLIRFQTTPNNGFQVNRMAISPAGVVGIGSGIGPTWPFMVDQSGNVTTSGKVTVSTAAGGLVLGSGANATTLSSTATSARAISFPNAGGTLARSGGGASYQATPFDPPGTSSAPSVQMGLAGSITPTGSGKVLIIVSGSIGNNSSGAVAGTYISYGTGVAPVNGAAFTGTAVGGFTIFTEPASPMYVPFSTNAIVTLTVGTTYWIDLDLAAGGGGTASVSNISISAMEMP